MEWFENEGYRLKRQSPPDGNTAIMINHVLDALKKHDIETEMLQSGAMLCVVAPPVVGAVKTQFKKCVFQ